MNFKRGLMFAAVGLMACGGSTPRADGGAGGGSGFDGGSSTGGGAGGGSALDAGTGGGVGEAFSFQVLEGDSAQPLINVAVRLAGPNSFVDGNSDANGQVALVLPGAHQRPLSLTVTRVDHGVLSIVGLTNEFPAQVRLDRTDVNHPQQPLPGVITGRSVVASTVIVDSIDFSTVRTTAGGWGTTYSGDSPWPLTLVGLELDATEQLVNWTLADAGVRNGGPMNVTLAFPSPAQAFSTVAWSASKPSAGILVSRQPLRVSVQGWHVVGPPNESWVVSGSGSVQAQGTGFAGSFCGITGDLAPNRLILEATDNASYQLRYRHKDLTGPIAIAMPQVDQVSLSGSTLGTLSARAVTPEPFDTLAITLELPGAFAESWRVYTAPGAPLTIDKLPDLPQGLTPSDLGIAVPTTTLNALPLLIRFEDPAMRPWQLQNGVGPLDAYRISFGGQYTQVSGTWR